MATIKSVSPRTTPTIDNVALTITGDGFTNAKYVYFEDSTNTKVTASAFEIVNDKRITTVIPPLAPGPVYVFVITGGEVAAVGMANIDKIYGPANMTLFGMVLVEERSVPGMESPDGYCWKVAPGLEQK